MCGSLSYGRVGSDGGEEGDMDKLKRFAIPLASLMALALAAAASWRL
jgi:hypothetical protein